MSQDCYSSVTRLLQQCHRTVTAVSQDCYSSITGLLQQCHRTVTAVSQDRYNCVTALSNYCNNSVTALSQDCNNSVTVLSQNCNTSVTLSQHCHRSVIIQCSSTVVGVRTLSIIYRDLTVTLFKDLNDEFELQYFVASKTIDNVEPRSIMGYFCPTRIYQ